MPSLFVEFTETKSEAIRICADMCRENLSDIIHKIQIQEIAFMKSRIIKNPKSYTYNMRISDDVTDEEEYRIIEANNNKIRKILGWKQIS